MSLRTRGGASPPGCQWGGPVPCGRGRGRISAPDWAARGALKGPLRPAWGPKVALKGRSSGRRAAGASGGRGAPFHVPPRGASGGMAQRRAHAAPVAVAGAATAHERSQRRRCPWQAAAPAPKLALHAEVGLWRQRPQLWV
eukprot:scaffold3768_cov376-Prasinococcus_capsulatus_cf.AAC.8